MAMRTDRQCHASGRSRWFGLFLAVAVFPLSESTCEAEDERVRPGILAKRGWYPEDPETLSASIDGFLAGVSSEGNTEANGRSGLPVRAVIVPHAGHAYSGRTAAYAYKAVANGSYKRIVMLGPTHTAHFRGGSIAPVEAYETPLGKIPLDREACDVLLKSEWFQEHSSAHTDEHCLEIQLPFVQRTLPGVKIIPILIGDIEKPSDCFAIAEVIRPLLGEDTLLLVSSDFTHQGNRFRYIPYRKETPVEEIPQIVRALDFYAVNQIINGNLSSFWSFLDRTRLTICGRNPIKILLATLPAQIQAGVLRYETSAEMTGDNRESVSYCSIVFQHNPAYLDEDEQTKLLKLARQRLVDTFEAGKTAEYKPAKAALTERLREKRGVFVTLQKEGRLRGCIGILEPVMALHEAVADRVIRSAFGDQRFSPLQEDELEKIEIEISVMTPLQSVASHKEIVLGRDGIVVEKGRRSAIYLPQVALDQGWDVEETLGHLCEKAGLSTEAWKEGCSFKTFQAQVFGERFKVFEGEES